MSTGASIGRVAYASRADLDEALDAAFRGLREEWQAVVPWQRGAILKRVADNLRADLHAAARTLTREQGKPLAEAVAHLVKDARARGAAVAAGGERIGNRGFFYAPTVLTGLPGTAEILRTEPFGPVVPILPFTDTAGRACQRRKPGKRQVSWWSLDGLPRGAGRGLGGKRTRSGIDRAGAPGRHLS